MEASTLRPIPSPYSMKLRLPSGSYVLRAETAGGMAGEVAFDMRTLDPDQPPVVLSER